MSLRTSLPGSVIYLVETFARRKTEGVYPHDSDENADGDKKAASDFFEKHTTRLGRNGARWWAPAQSQMTHGGNYSDRYGPMIQSKVQTNGVIE